MAIHADLDATVFQELSTRTAGELAALIRVGDVRFAIPVDRLLDRFQAEVGGQGIRNPPRQDPATGPVHHGEPIHEATFHRDVGDSRSPDLVRLNVQQVTEQIKLHVVCEMPATRVRLARQGMNAHLLHQCPYLSPSDPSTGPFEHPAEQACSGKQMRQVVTVSIRRMSATSVSETGCG